MSLDGIVVKSITDELQSLIIDGKIDKIYQPEQDEIVLNIRNKGENFKLLMSASSNNPRIYITQSSKINPTNPPMFCMLLRKHLQGGKIISIHQPSLERILKIGIQNLDELGIMTTKELVIELMGKHSNIILIEKESKKIIDSIKRIPLSVSSVRQVLPGLEYKLPPSQDKFNPIEINKGKFCDILPSSIKPIQVYKYLYSTFIGLSPLIAKEICYNANIEDTKDINLLTEKEINNLYASFKKIYDAVKNSKFTPIMIKSKNGFDVIAFSSVVLSQYGNLPIEKYNSVSCLLEDFYNIRDKMDRIKQKSTDLRKLVSNKYERALNKLAKQKDELIQANKREKYKIYGDLITANMYRIERKQSEIELENYYSQNLEKVKIKLNPSLSPSQNAQKYYKKYNKLKNAHEVVSEQLIKTQEEVQYFENILLSLDNCTELNELDEIREELQNEGYIKRSVSKNKKKDSKSHTSRPHHFISTDGCEIFVGKNNKQNDYLTLKIANKEDLWMHTKDIPGSHVIIKSKNNTIPESSIIEGALLAAYYSKAKMSSNVPIDYTERKNVKKPNGAKPGMVIYDYYNTIYVTPESEVVNKIKRIED
ncbi:Rqc2 family fibronectin-binding protein [Brassicibacter mesophilus]|uniref:Rqc2 family fibronectin-binding protein n=1 Tax=Brassicibacter mesophilus TaxID=745119 RepID=UPI003D1FD4E6